MGDETQRRSTTLLQAGCQGPASSPHDLGTIAPAHGDAGKIRSGDRENRATVECGAQGMEAHRIRNSFAIPHHGRRAQKSISARAENVNTGCSVRSTHGLPFRSHSACSALTALFDRAFFVCFVPRMLTASRTAIRNKKRAKKREPNQCIHAKTVQSGHGCSSYKRESCTHSSRVAGGVK